MNNAVAVGGDATLGQFVPRQPQISEVDAEIIEVQLSGKLMIATPLTPFCFVAPGLQVQT